MRWPELSEWACNASVTSDALASSILKLFQSSLYVRRRSVQIFAKRSQIDKSSAWPDESSGEGPATEARCAVHSSVDVTFIADLHSVIALVVKDRREVAARR